MAEQIQTVETQPQAAPGSAGLETQLPGQTTTVDGMAAAKGGIAPGQFIETDIDEELFKFESDDTPLCGLMLKAKSVPVSSPIVEHYQIDEEISTVTTIDKVQVQVLSLSFQKKTRLLFNSTEHCVFAA